MSEAQVAAPAAATPAPVSAVVPSDPGSATGANGGDSFAKGQDAILAKYFGASGATGESSDGDEPLAGELELEPDTDAASTRDEKGRFKSKAADKTPVEAADAADPGEAAESPDAADDKTDDAKASPIEPPAHWSAERKQAWATLSPAEQGKFHPFVAAREREFSQGMSKLGGKLKQVEERATQLDAFARPFDTIMRAHGDWFEASKAPPAQVFAGLMAFQRSWEANPAAAIIGLAQQAKIDLTDLALNVSNGAIPTEREIAAQAQLDDLRYRQAAIDQAEEARKLAEQAEQQEGQAAVRQEIAATIETVGAQLPGWSDVRKEIPDFIEVAARRNPDATDAELITTAWTMAVRNNPPLYAKLQAQYAEQKAKSQAGDEAKAAQAAKQAAARKRVEEAKRTSTIAVTGTPNPSGVVDVEAGKNAILRKFGIAI